MKCENKFRPHLGDSPSDISNLFAKLLIHESLGWRRNIADPCCRRTGGSQSRNESEIHVLGRLIVVFMKCTSRDGVVPLSWAIIVGQFAWLVAEQQGIHNVVSIDKVAGAAAMS